MANNLENHLNFEKRNEDGTTTVFTAQRFGVTSGVPAMHFAMDKQAFAEYYLMEVQRCADEMLNKLMKEWEKQNGK